jgi:hypothetical protein
LKTKKVRRDNESELRNSRMDELCDDMGIGMKMNRNSRKKPLSHFCCHIFFYQNGLEMKTVMEYTVTRKWIKMNGYGTKMDGKRKR